MPSTTCEITLQRNVQFLYEEHLAHLELESLGCENLRRYPDNPWRIKGHLPVPEHAILRQAAYVGELNGTPTDYSELIRPKYQGGDFNRTRSVNQYLTHWIYPYRGKFHPQMVRSLMNILGVHAGDRLMDPYLGSGTTALEAALLGIDFVGLDLSPLCVLLARVKTQSYSCLKIIRKEVRRLVDRKHLDPHDSSVEAVDHHRVSDFIRVARMVTLSDIARRRRDGEASFRKNLSAMIESVAAHATALDRFGIESGAVSVDSGDVRDLLDAGVAANSIDAVITSPPYSLALDYVANDAHALDALGVDIETLRDRMTGVRGKGRRQRMRLYNEDMMAMFRQIAFALRPGGRAAFVIGDATVGGREVTTTNQMSDWAVDAGLRKEREFFKIVYGLYSVMQQEKILVFRKPEVRPDAE